MEILSVVKIEVGKARKTHSELSCCLEICQDASQGPSIFLIFSAFAEHAWHSFIFVFKWATPGWYFFWHQGWWFFLLESRKMEQQEKRHSEMSWHLENCQEASQGPSFLCHWQRLWSTRDNLCFHFFLRLEWFFQSRCTIFCTAWSLAMIAEHSGCLHFSIVFTCWNNCPCRSKTQV